MSIPSCSIMHCLSDVSMYLLTHRSSADCYQCVNRHYSIGKCAQLTCSVYCNLQYNGPQRLYPCVNLLLAVDRPAILNNGRQKKKNFSDATEVERLYCYVLCATGILWRTNEHVKWMVYTAVRFNQWERYPLAWQSNDTQNDFQFPFMLNSKILISTLLKDISLWRIFSCTAAMYVRSTSTSRQKNDCKNMD